MTHICISVATLLIALTSGMFLLAKTKKDNLGTFHNIIAWFVIVLSITCLAYCGIRIITGAGHNMHKEKEIIINGMGGTEHMMRMNHGKHNMMEIEEDCCKMKNREGQCNNIEMNCCKTKMNKEDDCRKNKKIECKKDSVIIKK